MRKWIKRTFILLLFLLLLIVGGGYFLLSTHAGQQYLTQKITGFLETSFEVDVDIGTTHLRPFTDLLLEDVLLLDHQADTLLYAQELDVDIALLSLPSKHIVIENVFLKKALFDFKKYAEEESLNLTQFIQNFKSDKEGQDSWGFELYALTLEDSEFRYQDEHFAPKEEGFDTRHILVRDLHLEIDDVNIESAGLELNIVSLKTEEKSGLSLKSGQGHAEITGDSLKLMGMQIETLHSSLQGNYEMAYSDRKTGLSSFQVDILESDIHLSELGFLQARLSQTKEKIEATGRIKGDKNKLDLRDISLSLQRGGQVKTTGRIEGLADDEELHMQWDIAHLTTSVQELQAIHHPVLAEKLQVIPKEFSRLGLIHFIGKVDMDEHNMSINGHVDSELGSAKTDLTLDISSGQGPYFGYIQLEEFEAGKFVSSVDLGRITAYMDFDISGSREDLSAELDGEIKTLTYKGYEYRNMEVDGFFKEKLFNGFLSISRPEVDLDFRGKIDLRYKLPRFNFSADVYNVDLGALGFAPPLDSTSLTFGVSADFLGGEADQFLGDIIVEGLSFCKDEEQFYISEVDIHSVREDGERTMCLYSDALDAELSGRFRFKDLPGELISLGYHVLPSLYKDKPHFDQIRSTSQFELNYKDGQALFDMFLPGAYLSKGTFVEGKLDSLRQHFDLQLSADSMAYGEISLEHSRLELDKSADIAYLSMETRYMQWGDSLRFEDNFYTFNAYSDSIETDLTWSIVDKPASGSVSLLSRIYKPDSIVNTLFPSQVVMSGDYWLSEGFSEFVYDGKALHMDSILIRNEEERISLWGTIGPEENDRLDYHVHQFELEHLNKFLPKDVVSLGARTNLEGYAQSLLSDPTVVADLEMIDFRLGGERLGDIGLKSTWDKGNEYLDLLGSLNDKGREEVHLDGRFFPKNQEQSLDARLVFNGFELDILNKLPLGGVSDLGGEATGALEMQGTVKAPIIEGELNFSDAKVHVNYLNTTYYFSEKVQVREDYIGTNYIPFSDQFGNWGYLNGTVAHENYRDWNYDMYVEFENLLVFDTQESPERPFYGKAYGTGAVSLFGYDNNLTVEVFGKTEKGTVLKLPLGSSTEVVLDDFVYFRSEASVDREEEEKTPTAIELYIEAECTPDAEIELIFDEKIGDVMSGRGEGTLTMTLDRDGTFEMFGNYMVSEGDYLFTLQNVVNKKFTVQPGSSVSFFGDPYQAELDLSAIYSLRASLGDLLGQDQLTQSNRVPVQCVMNLEGALLNPDIGFDVEFPGLDPEARSLALNIIDTEEEKSRQVFSLLVLNKFLSTRPTGVGNEISSATANTINEFASAQLSNWLSQISDDVDIGVNYRAGDNITSEELAVALTTQLFNDRLLLSGNFGVQNSANSSVEKASSLIGDFRLEYILTKDGKLRLKVFNETNEYSVLSLDQAANKQGVGLVFQREFDGFFDDFYSDTKSE